MTDPSADYTFQDAIIIVADDPGAAEDARRAVAAAGHRVARVVAFAEAAGLSAQSAMRAILVEAVNANDAVLDHALAQVATIARDRDIGVVVALADDQIDRVWAAFAEPTTQLLCNPSVADRIAALATLPAAGRFAADVARDEGERLRLLNAEVARIAETLARLSRDDEERTSARSGLRESAMRFGVEPSNGARMVDAGEVRGAIRARRMRASHFPPDLFADPAWDMLLDLFAAGLEHRRVSVSSLCIAAAVPGTTALRWIGTMVDAGLFERHADPLDRRRAYVGLSDGATEAMGRYFETVRKAGLAPA